MVPGHVLSLIYKIFRKIHTFLPAPHEIKDPASVEICSSTSQPAMHGLPDCLIFVVLISHAIFILFYTILCVTFLLIFLWCHVNWKEPTSGTTPSMLDNDDDDDVIFTYLVTLRLQ